MTLTLMVLLSFSCQLFAKTTYDLKDLEVLVEENSTEEFFDHALDIRPGQRLEPWKAMVSKMAESYAQSLLKKRGLEEKDFKRMENLFTWPSLKKDDVFKIRRNEIGLRYLKSCLKGPSPCYADLKTFWEKDQTDPENAFRLSELSLGLKDNPYSTWEFLDPALKSPLSEFYCKKSFVMEALWGKVEMDYVKLGPEGDLMTKIDQTIHPDCVPHLISYAKNRLDLPLKTFDRELAYQVLKSQQKVTEEVTDYFYTLYLLDNPSQGELFNLSWNLIKGFGKNYDRRKNVLTRIKTLPAIPDGILGSLDVTKKRVILLHLKQHFPEVLEYYTDQCLLFYEGKKSFPKGNPTLHCQSFMDTELAPQIINNEKFKKYHKLRKI